MLTHRSRLPRILVTLVVKIKVIITRRQTAGQFGFPGCPTSPGIQPIFP